jgi:hypothetical protein
VLQLYSFDSGYSLVVLEEGGGGTSKGWVCDNFPRQFNFFLGTFHEKHKIKYLKNLTVKVCKIWCNDVYMSILQCDIFWWKLIDRIFFNPISRKVITHPSFASFFVCEIKNN